MVSRENRVVLASMALFFIAFFTIGFLEPPPVFQLAILAGIPIVLPQLYLALTDDSVNPRARVWTAGGVTLFFAAIMVANEYPVRKTNLLAVGGAVIVALLAYEFGTGYRSAS